MIATRDLPWTLAWTPPNAAVPKPIRSLVVFPEIDGFQQDAFTAHGVTHTLYRAGSGPTVIVMTEVPGITPAVIAFARRVVDLGCTAVLPQLFGTPGREPTNRYAASTMAKVCISSEFTVFARGRTSPIVRWLRALATSEHDRCGGPGVGVVGMCLTGGFALAMTLEEAVIAPVLSQPGLPAPMGAAGRADLGIDDDELTRISERVDREDLCVVGLRFTNDKLSPSERFASLRRHLGDNFRAIEIDSSPGNAWGFTATAHSVLTEEFVDEPGHPTREAMDTVMDLFRSRLLDAQDTGSITSG